MPDFNAKHAAILRAWALPTGAERESLLTALEHRYSENKVRYASYDLLRRGYGVASLTDAGREALESFRMSG